VTATIKAMRGALVVMVALAVVGCTKKDAEPSKKPSAKNGAKNSAGDAAVKKPATVRAADAAASKPVPPSKTATFKCGGNTCVAGQFCEERRKGHAVDDRGRPLQKKKCMALPKPCVAAPSCACVKAHISFKHCRVDAGNVFTDDYRR